MHFFLQKDHIKVDQELPRQFLQSFQGAKKIDEKGH